MGEPHLSTLERISPRAYIRVILCFGLHSGSHCDVAIQILRQGLKATAAQVPILNNIVVSVVDAEGRETKGPRSENVAMLSGHDHMSSWLDVEKIRSQGFQYDRWFAESVVVDAVGVYGFFEVGFYVDFVGEVSNVRFRFGSCVGSEV